MKKATPAWIPKIRKWSITGMILVIPVVLCSLWASHIKASTEKTNQRRALAAAEHARAWITLEPGQRVQVDLSRVTAPVKVEGVFLKAGFPDKGNQPVGAHAPIELDGGVMIDDTPFTRTPAQREDWVGHIVIHPGGKGIYRVWATATSAPDPLPGPPKLTPPSTPNEPGPKDPGSSFIQNRHDGAGFYLIPIYTLLPQTRLQRILDKNNNAVG